MSRKIRILVVDDDEDFRKVAEDILEMRDYEVSTAGDGLRALDLVQKEKFDLVIMDIRMPVMDGVETFKKMKAIIPNTPVLMVTAHAVEDLIREALREGAFAALYKPLDIDRLFTLIESALPDGAMILVVDDDENLCVTMKDNLERQGYRVNVALDGSAAIEKVIENNFDIVIIDMKLPPMNGLETYLAIRDLRPGVVAIIVTGYPEEMGGLAEKALNKNAYVCLEKPIDMDNLLLLIGEIEEKKSGGILSIEKHE